MPAVTSVAKGAGGEAFSRRAPWGLTGPFYTLILELTLPNLAALETTLSKVMGDKEFHANYEKFVPLVESGHRDVFSVVQ